jgi:hypothetical protein
MKLCVHFSYPTRILLITTALRSFPISLIILYVLKNTNSATPSYGSLITLNALKALSTVVFVGC